MANILERIGREAGLLRRYVVEVAECWRTTLGSAVVIALLWIAAQYGSSLLARVAPLAPEPVVPWLTRNRLIVVSVFLVLAVAQYLAWRTIRLAVDSEQPSLDERLRLLLEEPGLNAPQTKPWPAHYLILLLEAVAEIQPPAVEVECTDAIYQMHAEHHGKDRDAPLPSRSLVHLRHNLVRAEFSVTALSPGDKIRIVLHSPSSLRLKSARAGNARLHSASGTGWRRP